MYTYNRPWGFSFFNKGVGRLYITCLSLHWESIFLGNDGVANGGRVEEVDA